MRSVSNLIWNGKWNGTVNVANLSNCSNQSWASSYLTVEAPAVGASPVLPAFFVWFHCVTVTKWGFPNSGSPAESSYSTMHGSHAYWKTVGFVVHVSNLLLCLFLSLFGCINICWCRRPHIDLGTGSQNWGSPYSHVAGIRGKLWTEQCGMPCWCV